LTQVTDKTALDDLCVNTIRTLSMDAVQKANSGHPGAPMALAPLAYVLYTRVMKHNPADPHWPDRDRFVLSAGHASMLLYSTLHLTGYGLTLDDLRSFRQLNSPTAGHPEYRHAAGIEVTTGPLGQGISNAVGLALAERMMNARWGDELQDHHTFVIASDGDLQEGVSAEASSFAGHLGLGRLIAFYDNNHIQLDGPTDAADTEDVAQRYESYGWHVVDLGEEIELDRLQRAAEEAKAVEDRPSMIVMRTHIGYGSPNKQDSQKAHGSPLGEDEVRLTKEFYGWPPDEHFRVPEEALEHFRTTTAERGKEAQGAWEQRLIAFREREPDRAAEWDRIIEGRLPDSWPGERPKFHPDDGMIATRKAGHQVLQWAAGELPELAGGAADLKSSTLTEVDDSTDVEPGHFEGRNIRFGVREHGMGAIVNGMNLHYFRAYGSTFFNFADYMKGAIRLAAVMRIGSIFVFTHDSIGLGEDGPTHQPVEQLAMLRAMPNLNMVRPAGGNETVLAWKFAIENKETPTAMALSRQGLPSWNPAGVPDDAIERGAYVLRDSFKEPEDPDLILIATGSEVHLCTRAADLIEAEGIAVRVVSMPCMDTFANTDQAYREQVLPHAVRARVAVEAAAKLGWDRWVGEDGAIVGMDTFGASAPAGALFEHFGFTPKDVADKGRAVLKELKEQA